MNGNTQNHAVPVDRGELVELVRSIVDMDDIFSQSGDTRLGDATQTAYRAIKKRSRELYRRLQSSGEIVP